MCTVGAVSAQTYWLESGQTDGQSVLQDRTHTAPTTEAAASTPINYHPTVQLTTPLALLLTKNDYAQCQLFTVYQSDEADSEGLIWKMCQAGEDQLIGTDQRMVDLSIGKYMNYIDHTPYEAQLTSYQHYRSDFAADVLVLGSEPTHTDIPVRAYQGALAEMIAFDRVLAPTTKQAIESYLAVKYSIPLTVGMDYVDLQGDAYWKYSSNKDYAHRVAGVGKYSALGLNQKQSKSQFGNGTISLGLGKEYEYNTENIHELSDESYLLWSDDDGLIDFDSENGNPATLIRKWKVNTVGAAPDQPLFFYLAYAGLAHDLADGLSYWLRWGADAETTELDQCEYYQLQETADGYYADGIVAHESDQSYFTLVQAPDLFTQLAIKAVDCEAATEGTIAMKPIGGMAPYSVQLSDAEGQKVYSETYPSNKAATLSDLPMGKYTLELQDGRGQQYETTFYLNGNIASSIEIPKSIVLEEDHLDFTLDIEDTAALDFLWTSPAGNISTGASTIFHESGTHTLQVTNGQCQAWHTTEIISRASNIATTHLSPNPSTDGNFRYEAILKEAAPYTLMITNLSGVSIYQRDYPAAKYITFQDRLLRPGTYLITLVSEGSTATDKLIVIR